MLRAAVTKTPSLAQRHGTSKAACQLAMPLRQAATMAQQPHEEQRQQQQQQQKNQTSRWAWAAVAAGGLTAGIVSQHWLDEHHWVKAEASATAPKQPLNQFNIDKAKGEHPHRFDVKGSRIKPTGTTKPEHFDHIIIGAGQAARACMRTIDQQQQLIQGSKSSPPPKKYKTLMVAEERSTRINAFVSSVQNKEELQRFDASPNTTVLFGQSVDKLDVDAKLIQLKDGRIYSFGKLFIGTGGVQPEGLPCTNDKAAQRIYDLRTLHDLEDLDKAMASGEIKNIAVVGGGIFGVEAALEINRRNRDKNVTITQIYAEPGVLYKILPEYFRAYVTSRLRDMGIAQKNFSLVSKVDVYPNSETDEVYVEIDSWERSFLRSDLVVYAPTTVSANTELVQDSGLEVDENNGGLVVNHELAAATDVYAGGDVISYPNVVLGRRRDQIYDHAIASGVIAAHNMMGERWPYTHLPVQRIDMQALGLQIEMVGVIDARCETVGIWDATKRRTTSGTGEWEQRPSKFDRGIVYYMNNGFIVGVMLINVPHVKGQDSPVDSARSILYDQVDYTGVDNLEAELQTLIPQLHCENMLVKHINARSVVRDVVHGRDTLKLPRNPYKMRRTLMADAQLIPEDFLRATWSPIRIENVATVKASA